MKRKRYTEEQIIGFLKQVDAGLSVLELCREPYPEKRTTKEGAKSTWEGGQ